MNHQTDVDLRSLLQDLANIRVDISPSQLVNFGIRNIETYRKDIMMNFRESKLKPQEIMLLFVILGKVKNRRRLQSGFARLASKKPGDPYKNLCRWLTIATCDRTADHSVRRICVHKIPDSYPELTLFCFGSANRKKAFGVSEVIGAPWAASLFLDDQCRRYNRMKVKGFWEKRGEMARQNGHRAFDEHIYALSTRDEIKLIENNWEVWAGREAPYSAADIAVYLREVCGCEKVLLDTDVITSVFPTGNYLTQITGSTTCS